jgi:NAD(P)H-dependent FMN reductase
MAVPLNIKVILGSTREGRFGERPAQWLCDEMQKEPDVAAELLDLRAYPLPFFKETVSPGMLKEPYPDEAVRKWTQKIAEGDGFIMVTPEYNHGYSAVLKNALDYVYKEWNRKPVGFVSYGGVGGARAVEQLREVAIELQMAPIRNAIHIQWPLYMAIASAPVPVPPETFDQLKGAKETMFADLLWWARALKTARA